MNPIDFDNAIRLHNAWRRQFMNAFAAGSYAEMPLSGHRGCQLAEALAAAPPTLAALPQLQQLIAVHARFHALANEIIELSDNGLADAADLMLPELAEQSFQLAGLLDELRDLQRADA